MCSSVDVNEIIEAEETLSHQALHDPLTSLPNRKAVQERMDVSIGIANRNNTKLAILFIDLDGFKNINDTLGHDIGDLLLQEVAYRLKSIIRQEDTIARLGGDEFLVILNEIGSVHDATKIAKKLLDSLEAPIRISGNSLKITGSLGIAIYPNDGVDFIPLLRNADMAMYRAKEAGRRRYQLYNVSMNKQLSARLVLEKSLRKAIDKEQFTLHFQPYVNLSTGMLQGVEALVRWNHPKLGLLSPKDFIS